MVCALTLVLYISLYTRHVMITDADAHAPYNNYIIYISTGTASGSAESRSKMVETLKTPRIEMQNTYEGYGGSPFKPTRASMERRKLPYSRVRD